LGDILIPEFDQETLFEGSDTAFSACLFKHSDQGTDLIISS
jgi:hypothetical protein